MTTPFDTSDLKQALEQFVEAGGNPTHQSVQRQINSAHIAAQAAYTAQSAPPNAAVRDDIDKQFGLLASWFVRIVMVGGVGAMLVIIPLAEVSSVYIGLLAITPEAWALAAITSVALFIGYIALSFFTAAYHVRLPEDKGAKTLRQRLAGWVRWVGMTQWNGVHADECITPTKLERTYRALYNSLWYTKVAILGASLRGRLDSVVVAHGNAPVGDSFSAGAGAVTGAEFLGMILSLFVLWAMLVILDTSVKFVYTAFTNTAGHLDLGNSSTAVVISLEALQDAHAARAYQNMTLVLVHRSRTALPPPNQTT